MIRGETRSDDDTPLAGVAVALDGTAFIITTGADGRFAIRAPTMSVTLRARRIGFESIIILVAADEGTDARPVILRLHPAAAQLLGVLIPGARTVALGQTVTRATVRHVPPLGEPDVMRALPLLPGVTQPNDLLSRVHLAGAAGDETLVTLDGHPMQFPTHLSGIIGGFNVAAIDRVEVLSHHVPATLDSRLGGTLALNSREREPTRSGEVVATLLATSLTVSEPALPGGIDLLISARVTYMDELFRRIYGSARAAQDPLPAYADGLLRVGADRGEWRAEGIGYLTRDWTDQSQVDGSRELSVMEGLAGMSLTRQRPGERLRLRFSFDESRTVRAGAVAADGLLLEQRWLSGEATLDRSLSAGTDLVVSAAADQHDNAHTWGIAADRPSPDLPAALRSAQSQLLVSSAASLRRVLARQWTASVGARASTVGEGVFVAPRLQVSKQLSQNLRLETALDRRYQFDMQIGEPEDGTVTPPVFLLDEPRRVDALAIALEFGGRSARGSEMHLSATLFGRAYAGRADPTSVPGDTTLQSAPAFARIPARSAGIAAGITFATAGGAALQSSYTYTRADQRTADGWMPSDWDTPHTFSALLSIPVLAHWTFTTVAQLHAGVPTTPVASAVLVPSVPFPDVLSRRLVYGAPNSARLPGFRRLDLAMRRAWSPGPFELVLTLQAVNVFARENVLAYDWNRYLQQIEFGRSPQASRAGTPFVPSIGVEVRW